ncbi:hypothetical protein C8R43DRAFT_1106424 [Mycena crocata]|nr:hypothetical protein C8R43DRAFT_1106424 [Mycena crocata]
MDVFYGTPGAATSVFGRGHNSEIDSAYRRINDVEGPEIRKYARRGEADTARHGSVRSLIARERDPRPRVNWATGRSSASGSVRVGNGHGRRRGMQRDLGDSQSQYPDGLAKRSPFKFLGFWTPHLSDEGISHKREDREEKSSGELMIGLWQVSIRRNGSRNYILADMSSSTCDRCSDSRCTLEEMKRLRCMGMNLLGFVRENDGYQLDIACQFPELKSNRGPGSRMVR